MLLEWIITTGTLVLATGIIIAGCCLLNWAVSQITAESNEK